MLGGVINSLLSSSLVSSEASLILTTKLLKVTQLLTQVRIYTKRRGAADLNLLFHECRLAGIDDNYDMKIDTLAGISTLGTSD